MANATASSFSRRRGGRRPTRSQTATSGGVEGYEAVSVPYTGCNWGGLERSTNDGNAALIDGSVNSNAFWYTVGGRQTTDGDGLLPRPVHL